MNCLETLARNSEKAGFVRFLTTSMGHVNHEDDDHWEAIGYLYNGLVNMHFLSDFRLRLPARYGIQPRDCESR